MFPLQGVRVVEFCEFAAGPMCGVTLADLGADVIKVERPGSGDAMRMWPPIENGFGHNFASVNRNKRSIALDLRVPEDQRTALRLIAQADVVVENYRPGVMAKNKLAYLDAKQVNANIVYCSISAFGQTGPRSGEGGFDLTLQAISGVMSVTGSVGGEPCKSGVPLSDFCSGLYGVTAILSALFSVRNGAEGCHIDLSMLASTLSVSALQTSEYFGNGIAPKALGSAHPRNAPYRAFKAKDRSFAIAAGNDSLWAALCRACAVEHLMADPRFQSPTLRAKHQDALRVALEEVFVAREAQHWLDTLSAVGVPCAPINTFSEALDDVQVQHLGLVEQTHIAGVGELRTLGSPFRFNDVREPIRRAPPLLDQHRDDILNELSRLENS